MVTPGESGPDRLDIGTAEPARSSTEIVEEIGVSIVNECSADAEVFFGPDPLPTEAVPVKIPAGATISRRMRTGERMWYRGTPEHRVDTSAWVMRDGSVIRMLENCNGVGTTEGSGPRLPQDRPPGE